MLCAKIVYDDEQIEEFLGKKTEKEYKEKIWDEIKEINKKCISRRNRNINK